MSGRVDGVLPFWLDRPDEEAISIALEVQRAGFDTLWIGELATFDAVALATAVGHRVEGIRIKVGPLAIGVRSPVAIALGVSSVAALTDSDVGVALGASSPVIVSGWHDREWAHAASRMHETVESLRAILAGERSHYDGRHVRTHGFRLRHPRPDIPISVAAFGPAMTRVAARHADEVLLNLVPPEHVSAVRATVDAEATRCREDGARPGGLGPGCPGAGRRGAGTARLAAGDLPWRARLRRDVLRARVRRAGAPGAGGRPPRPSWPAPCRSSSWSGSAPSALPTRSPRASPPTTTPAPTWSASRHPRPRIRAAAGC